VLFFTGCFYSSTLTSARVLAPGKISIGMNLSGHYKPGNQKVIPTNLSVQSRVGVLKKIDLGIGITGLPPSGMPAVAYSINSDLKIQLLQAPTALTVQIGGYRGQSMAIDFGSHWSGRTSSVIIGRDKLYFALGLQLVTNTTGGFDKTVENYTDEPVVFMNIGKEFGNRFVVTPEIGMMHFRGEIIPTFGAGIKFSPGNDRSPS